EERQDQFVPRGARDPATVDLPLIDAVRRYEVRGHLERHAASTQLQQAIRGCAQLNRARRHRSTRLKMNVELDVRAANATDGIHHCPINGTGSGKKADATAALARAARR